jgi:hypothetical protein
MKRIIKHVLQVLGVTIATVTLLIAAVVIGTHLAPDEKSKPSNGSPQDFEGRPLDSWAAYQSRLVKIAESLDYSKPLFSRDHTVVCPPTLLSNDDPLEGYSSSDVMQAYFDHSATRRQRAERVGCQEWHAGVELIPLEADIRNDRQKLSETLGVSFSDLPSPAFVFVRSTVADGPIFLMTLADEVTNDPTR